jgi:UDP-GlcNAc:undecaprenyl-phosphate/decaprenyl-phosphate GlcNAc-1-phosphate transferase
MNEPYLLTYYMNYPVFLLISILFSVLINKIFLKFAGTLGIRNETSQLIRWSTQSKPSLGGISFYLIFLLSIAFHSIFDTSQNFIEIKFLGILSATTLAFIVGLADDAYNTNPLAKFMGQLTCGLLLSITGTNIELFDSVLLNGIITVFWVVALMNSLNMLDNMDGITTIVSIFIILGAMAVLFSNTSISGINLIILIGSLGALVGFLFYNWNPSKMYMGDTGSQFIGCLLAFISIEYFWNYQPAIGNPNFSLQFILVALAFLIPLTDTATVSINRLRKGQSPFVGGKDHTTHHLSYLGLSDKQVARLYALISSISLVFIYVIINFIENWSLIHFFAFSSYIIICALGLFMTTQVKKAKAS